MTSSFTAVANVASGHGARRIRETILLGKLSSPPGYSVGSSLCGGSVCTSHLAAASTRNCERDRPLVSCACTRARTLAGCCPKEAVFTHPRSSDYFPSSLSFHPASSAPTSAD